MYFAGLPHNEVLPALKEKVVEFKQGMPVITSLRNPSLKHRYIIGYIYLQDCHTMKSYQP